MKKAVLLLLAGFTLAGCDAITVPRRHTNEVFEFRLLTGADSLVLRWPNGSLIRVFLQPSGTTGLDTTLTESFRHAARAWEAVSLYGDYRFDMARAVEAADVILTWSDVALPVNTANCRPGGSNAFTTFCLTAEGDRLEPFPILDSNMPSRVRFLVTIRPGPLVTPERARTLITHELGHVLGLIQHSPAQSDIMFADPTGRNTPNARDRASVQVLYQTKPDIIP